MKVLELNLFLLKFLGLYSDETTNRFLQTFRFIFFLTGNIFPATLCPGIYLYYHLSELETSTNALIVFNGGMSGVITFITLGTKLKAMQLIYQSLQQIVNNGKGDLKKNQISLVGIIFFWDENSRWHRCHTLLSWSRTKKSTHFQIHVRIYVGQCHILRIYCCLC